MKIKIALIKNGGLGTGGTEKFLQTIAANLPKDIFDVDYYYSDITFLDGLKTKSISASTNRYDYLQGHGVNLIKFDIHKIDPFSPYGEWIQTNFWKKFDESKYSIIQIARGGAIEYPFYKIRNTPIVDSLHLVTGVDNQYNIARVIHITKWSRDKWVSMGGDISRTQIIYHPMSVQFETNENYLKELNIQNRFIYGFHQRVSDYIFSSIPLKAYKLIETPHNHFMMLGGSEKYKIQAQELGIKNITFLEHTDDPQKIYKFLNTLNVYSHGRYDGEINSTAMAEAMYFGLPIVSHPSHLFNGHIECIGEAGFVESTIEQYSKRMIDFETNNIIYQKYRKFATSNFYDNYDLRNQMNKIQNLYNEVINNPFPDYENRKKLEILNKKNIFGIKRTILFLIKKIFKYLLNII
ncbi:MAG: glycosyltransferase [Cytophagales bacterium]|nr:glycosyltransferase [Cytophagales bacterium]